MGKDVVNREVATIIPATSELAPHDMKAMYKKSLKIPFWIGYK
jgi:hypothetical protein